LHVGARVLLALPINYIKTVGVTVVTVANPLCATPHSSRLLIELQLDKHAKGTYNTKSNNKIDPLSGF
jgi:hypothetical protein